MATSKKSNNRKRRGRGEGGIYQRQSDNLWTGAVTVGYDENGKRIRKVVYGKTKAEALQKMRKATDHAVASKKELLRVGGFLDAWLESQVKPHRAAGTYHKYKHLIDKHIKPKLGGMALDKVTPFHVENFYATITLGASNGRVMGSILQKAFDHAVKRKLVPFNPVRGVQKPTLQKTEMRTWTGEEARAFLEAAEGDRLHAMFVLALTTGMRQGELFGLKWTDIDFDHNTLQVQRTLDEYRGTLTPKTPKTAKSRRRIELSQIAVDALRQHLADRMAEGNAAAPVFCDRDGGWLRKSNVQRRHFVPAVEAAGVPLIRFHDLRHSAATLLLAKGTHPKVVSDMLGHASVEITLNTYSHVIPSLHREAASQMDSILSPVATVRLHEGETEKTGDDANPSAATG